MRRNLIPVVAPFQNLFKKNNIIGGKKASFLKLYEWINLFSSSKNFRIWKNTSQKKKNIFIFIFIPSSTRPTHPYHTSPPNHHHSITQRPVTVSGLLSTKARTSDQVSSSTSGRRQISIWLPSLIFLRSQEGFIPREFGDGDGPSPSLNGFDSGCWDV